MALTSEDRAELRRLRNRRVALRAYLLTPPKTREERARYLERQEELDLVVARIAELEAQERGDELSAAQEADARRRDYLEALSAEQVRAGEAIGRIYGAQSAAMRAALAERLTAGLVRKHLELAALARDDEIRRAMERMQRVSGILNREAAVRTWGKDAAGGLRAMGVMLGGGQDPDLVDRVWNQAKREGGFRVFLEAQDKLLNRELTQVVNGLAKLGKDARRSWDVLREAGFPDARVSGWVRQLETGARDVLRGIPGAAENYAALRRQTIAYLRQRKPGPGGVKGLGTQQAGFRLLRDLDVAIGKAEQGAVGAAVDKWVQKKGRYNATTVMRTATNETLRQANRDQWRQAPYVVAVRRILSVRHPVPDYCDAVCSADLLGWGPGVYLISQVPEEHASGLCREEPVLDTEFLDNGGIPLGIRKPAGYDEAVRDLGFSGSLGRKFTAQGRRSVTLRSGEGVPRGKPVNWAEELSQRGLIRERRVPTQRTVDVDGDNLIQGRKPTKPPRRASAPEPTKVQRPRTATTATTKPRGWRDPVGAVPAAREELRRREAKTRENKTEKAVAIDPRTGEILLEKRGGKSSVAFSVREVLAMSKKDALITHNHPSGGFPFAPSFSPADISLAVLVDAAEMRAVPQGLPGVYVMRRPAKGWQSLIEGEEGKPATLNAVRARIAERAKKAEGEHMARWMKKVRAGQATYTDVNLHMYDDIWKELAEEFGLDYSYEVPD